MKQECTCFSSGVNIFHCCANFRTISTFLTPEQNRLFIILFQNKSEMQGSLATEADTWILPADGGMHLFHICHVCCQGSLRWTPGCGAKTP